MKFNLEKYNYSKRNFKEAKFFKEGILIAIGFIFLVVVLIFTN